MTDPENPNTPDPETPKRGRVKTAIHAADRASTTMEAAGSAFGAIKWVAIAIVVLVLFGSAFAAYKIVSKPVVMAGEAAEKMTGAVKVGSEKVIAGTSDLKNRLVIPITNQEAFDAVADTVFARLVDIEETEPEGMKDRLFRRTNFPGSENKICELALDFGTGDIPVFMAADNKAYATARSLGSDDDRLMRVVIRTEDDDVEMNAEWDTDAADWVLKWKATTVKKRINDTVALERVLDVLNAAKGGC